ncbi:MAG TPA: hypothetical protein VLA43_13335 [Longimicrobiales bacterium]|nr:hypothetical protein [Longimicrobiales bacterium]
MVMQSVTDRLGAMVQTLGQELGSVADAAGRNPGTTTLIVALVVGVLIALALSSR